MCWGRCDMETAIDIFLFIFACWLGAVSHEADLSRNFKKYNDAKSWFFSIKKRG